MKKLKRVKTIRVRGKRPRIMRRVARKVRTKKVTTKRRPKMRDYYHKEE